MRIARPRGLIFTVVLVSCAAPIGAEFGDKKAVEEAPGIAELFKPEVFLAAQMREDREAERLALLLTRQENPDALVASDRDYERTKTDLPIIKELLRAQTQDTVLQDAAAKPVWGTIGHVDALQLIYVNALSRRIEEDTNAKRLGSLNALLGGTLHEVERPNEVMYRQLVSFGDMVLNVEPLIPVYALATGRELNGTDHTAIVTAAVQAPRPEGAPEINVCNVDGELRYMAELTREPNIHAALFKSHGAGQVEISDYSIATWSDDNQRHLNGAEWTTPFVRCP